MRCWKCETQLTTGDRSNNICNKCAGIVQSGYYMKRGRVPVPELVGYIQFHSGPGIWEKRWKALRKEVRKQHEIQVSDAIQELMTKITRKIK